MLYESDCLQYIYTIHILILQVFFPLCFMFFRFLVIGTCLYSLDDCSLKLPRLAQRSFDAKSYTFLEECVKEGKEG